MDLVQQAMSEKVPVATCYFSTFVTGFVLGFIRSCRLMFAQSSVFPWLMCMGVLMMKFVGKHSKCVLFLTDHLHFIFLSRNSFLCV